MFIYEFDIDYSGVIFRVGLERVVLMKNMCQFNSLCPSDANISR